VADIGTSTGLVGDGVPTSRRGSDLACCVPTWELLLWCEGDGVEVLLWLADETAGCGCDWELRVRCVAVVVPLAWAKEASAGAL
jgi:hypothetical protein